MKNDTLAGPKLSIRLAVTSWENAARRNREGGGDPVACRRISDLGLGRWFQTAGADELLDVLFQSIPDDTEISLHDPSIFGDKVLGRIA